MSSSIYFAVPGDIDTLTGGYAYDRELIAGLRGESLDVQLLRLSSSFPAPDAAVLAETDALFASLPQNAVVIVDGLAYGVMERIAARHCERLKLVALCHHPLALESGLDRESVARLRDSERRALGRARAVIVTSPSTGRVLREQYELPAEKITVAVPGTVREDFSPCHGDPPVLLTVATLIRRKAHDVLIRALARQRHLRWQARFVGGENFDPAWTAGLRALVEEHELQQRVVFVGEVPELRPEYRQADVFVLPSLHEGYGMAFAEALARGLPIIAARAGAVPDLVPETAGLLVPPGDVAALSAALGRMLGDAALRLRLREGARQAAARLQDWPATTAIVADLIRGLE